MTFDYTKTAATSLRLLTNFGQDVTRIAYTSGSYDPATGSTTPTTANTTRKGALLELGSDYATNALVESGDKRLLVDAEADIDLEDHFTVDGTEYQIMSVGEINPAGTAVLYDLHVRVS